MLVPDGGRLSAMGCRFRQLEAPHECIISLPACVSAFGVSLFVFGTVRQLQSGVSALCHLLTTEKTRAKPHSTFNLHIGMPALIRKQKKMPQGRLATIKLCIMKPEDTEGELNFNKVTLVKLLSINSCMPRVGELQSSGL